MRNFLRTKDALRRRLRVDVPTCNEAGDWSAAAAMQSRSSVILRDFSPAEPALSEVKGIWRAPAQLPAFFPMRSAPDAALAQHDPSLKEDTNSAALLSPGSVPSVIWDGSEGIG